MSSKKRKGKTHKQQNKINKNILQRITSEVKQSIKQDINPIIIKINQKASFRRIQLEKILHEASFRKQSNFTVSITIEKIHYFYQNIAIHSHKQIAFLLIGNVYIVFINGKKLQSNECFTKSFRSILISLSKLSEILQHTDIACILQYFQHTVMKIYDYTSEPLLSTLKYLSMVHIYGYQPKFMFASFIQAYSNRLLQSTSHYLPYSVCDLIFRYYYMDVQDTLTTVEMWNKIVPRRYALKFGDDYAFKAKFVGRQHIPCKSEIHITFGIIQNSLEGTMSSNYSHLHTITKILNGAVCNSFHGYRHCVSKWQWSKVNYIQLFINLKDSQNASLQACINGTAMMMKEQEHIISKNMKKIRFTIEPEKVYFPFIAVGLNYFGNPDFPIQYSLHNFALFYQNKSIHKCYK